MEIRPTYLIMVTKENNNKYYNCFPEGERFRVEYGRVDSTKQTTSYPMSKWNSQINSKLKKGYVDVTDTKQDLIEEVSASNPDMTYKEIENKVIKDIVEKLQSMARETIKKNYSVKSSTVTQAMIDEAQIVLNELSHIDDTDDFNDKLLELFAIIPRKMGNVKDYLCDNLEEFSDIIQREQDLLDVMQGEVYKPEKHIKEENNENKKDFTILDELGLEFEETTDEEVKMIKELMGDQAYHYYSSWRVTNLATKKAFDEFTSKNNIDNHKILCHGSKNPNFWGICKQGLRIKPQGVPEIGSMFGRGIYYSNPDNYKGGVGKSINYTSLNGSYWAHGNSNFGFIAFFDVALGKSYDVYKFDSAFYNFDLKKLKEKDKDAWSLFAHSSSGMLRNDEIIVYAPEQVNIKWLVEIR